MALSVALYVFAQVVLLAAAAKRGAILRQAQRFERHGITSGRGARILVLGDSTGVGVGAGHPEDSLAGLLGRDFIEASIENRSVNGACLDDALDQSGASDDRAHYDVVLVHAGGIDAVRGLSLRKTARNAEALMRALAPRAEYVVWFGCANIGLSPLFLPPFGRVVSARLRRANRLFRQIAERHGASFVDYFRKEACDPYSKRPEHFYAVDGFHPSGAAYRYCYHELRRNVPIDAWLRDGASRHQRAGADAERVAVTLT